MTVAATLLVRADAHGRLGIGHLMRPLALVSAWQAAGGQATFVSHCPVERLRRRIRACRAGLVPLEHSWPDPADLAAVLALLAKTRPGNAKSGPTWVVLDGYQFDPHYQQAIRNAGGRLLVIDDMAHLEHYHADVLLNQNLGAEQLNYACRPESVLLLGCRYALLRPEFHPWKSFQRDTPKTARKLLVTLGGADPNNVTLMVIRAIERLELPGLEVKVVVGPANLHLESLRDYLQSPSETPPTTDVQLLTDAADMPELMAWADAAVVAGGTTCWELAFMRLPAAVIVLADNQQPVAERLSESGAVTNLGRSEQLTAKAIAEALAALCRDRSRRASQSEAGRRLVDGRGAERGLAVMRALDSTLPAGQVRLRPVAAEDLLPLWRLVNDPAVRRASLVSSDPIPLDEHLAWFRGRLSSPATRMWVLDFHGLVVAVIRYDRTEPAVAEISLQVTAAFRRQGLATRLLDETRQRVCEELGVNRLRAVVRQENLPSARTFAKAGFTRVDSRVVQDHPCYVFETT